MMGHTTLREIREAIAAAKAKGSKASRKSPIVKELEALARRLEQEVKEGGDANAPGRPKNEN